MKEELFKWSSVLLTHALDSDLCTAWCFCSETFLDITDTFDRHCKTRRCREYETNAD